MCAPACACLREGFIVYFRQSIKSLQEALQAQNKFGDHHDNVDIPGCCNIPMQVKKRARVVGKTPMRFPLDEFTQSLTVIWQR